LKKKKTKIVFHSNHLVAWKKGKGLEDRDEKKEIDFAFDIQTLKCMGFLKRRVNKVVISTFIHKSNPQEEISYIIFFLFQILELE
jgi:hypothetical protein